MLGNLKEETPELLNASKDVPQEQEPVDLYNLAEKIVEKLLQELSIENERMGY
jgi:hypothetical protein